MTKYEVRVRFKVEYITIVDDQNDIKVEFDDVTMRDNYIESFAVNRTAQLITNNAKMTELLHCEVVEADICDVEFTGPNERQLPSIRAK